MAAKVNAALVGSGNIGTDLLYKALRSEWIRPVWMVGIDAKSEGLAMAREKGLKTTADGVDGLLPHIAADDIRIAFDATSAYVHAENARKLQSRGVVVVDLTPAAIGPYCVPPVNLTEHVGKREMNVNMVSCGGQATIPMVAAVSRVQPVELRRDRRDRRLEIRRPRHAQEHRRVHPHDRARHREGGRREARQGDHHPQSRRTAAHHARHGALPDRGRRPTRRGSPPRCTR